MFALDFPALFSRLLSRCRPPPGFRLPLLPCPSPGSRLPLLPRPSPGSRLLLLPRPSPGSRLPLLPRPSPGSRLPLLPSPSSGPRLNIPSIEDWPVPKLLEVLFKNDIPAPVGASHEELFALFKENIRSETAFAFFSNYSVPKKSAEKRKNCSRNCSIPSSSRRAAFQKRVPDEAASSAYPADNDPMVSALNNIQSLLATMNSRIQVLESGATHSAGPSSSDGGMLPSSLSAGPAHGPAGSSPFAGPAHGPTGVTPDDDVTAARSDSITFPRRTLPCSYKGLTKDLTGQ